MNPARAIATVACLAAAAPLGGCVLPIPGTRTIVPAVQGRVVDAGTGAPVDMAGVVVEGHKHSSVLTSRDGTFRTDPVTRSSPFRVWNPFAKAETGIVKLRFARPGYEKHSEKVPWRPGEQEEVHLVQPIGLRPKGLEDTARDALRQAL